MAKDDEQPSFLGGIRDSIKSSLSALWRVVRHPVRTARVPYERFKEKRVQAKAERDRQQRIKEIQKAATQLLPKLKTIFDKANFAGDFEARKDELKKEQNFYRFKVLASVVDMFKIDNLASDQVAMLWIRFSNESQAVSKEDWEKIENAIGNLRTHLVDEHLNLSSESLTTFYNILTGSAHESLMVLQQLLDVLPVLAEHNIDMGFLNGPSYSYNLEVARALINLKEQEITLLPETQKQLIQSGHPEHFAEQLIAQKDEVTTNLVQQALTYFREGNQFLNSVTEKEIREHLPHVLAFFGIAQKLSDDGDNVAPALLEPLAEVWRKVCADQFLTDLDPSETNIFLLRVSQLMENLTHMEEAGFSKEQICRIIANTSNPMDSMLEIAPLACELAKAGNNLAFLEDGMRSVYNRIEQAKALLASSKTATSEPSTLPPPPVLTSAPLHAARSREDTPTASAKTPAATTDPGDDSTTNTPTNETPPKPR